MSINYPLEVQERIEVLNKYLVDKSLNTFNIMHLYTNDLAYPNGYCDSRYFTPIIFNTELNTKRELGQYHDGVTFKKYNNIQEIRIFADGSTIIVFSEPMYISKMLTSSFEIMTKEEYRKWYT